MTPLSDATNILGEPIKIHDTFPYNPESKTAPNTAKRWANTDRYDYATKTTIVGPEPVIIDRVNEPFSVTITDLHFRSEGGRAYKVVDEEMRRFDLREDQVIEVMRNVGIAPGGAVPATFVWGMLGSQMRLVLVGGELHKSMMAGLQEKKDFDLAASSGMHPTEATLQPGHIYRKKDKTLHLFIGRVKRSDVTKSFFAFVQMPEAPRNWDDVDLDAHYYGNCREEWKAEREIAKKWDSMSWVDRCQWTWYDQREFTQKQYPTATPGYYHCPGNIVLMSSPKFEADVGEEVEFAERIRLNEIITIVESGIQVIGTIVYPMKSVKNRETKTTQRSKKNTSSPALNFRRD